MNTDLIPLFLIIAAVVALALWANKKKQRPYYRASSKPWSINNSVGLPDSPEMTGPDSWRITLPPDKPARLGYVQRYNGQPVVEGNTITARIRVSGQFRTAEAGKEPTMTLLLHRKGSNLASPGYRYFSKATVPLTEGEHVLSVPVTPEYWGDVIGGTTTEGFLRVLAELESVGVMFGANDGRGHGVVGGGASVELVSLAVG